MDGLALLCNLHADGPLTLRRLREAGVRSLFDLEKIQSSSLALVLHASATQARRFAEEGKILSGRLEEEPLEPEALASESGLRTLAARSTLLAARPTRAAPPVAEPALAERTWRGRAVAELALSARSEPVFAAHADPRPSAPVRPRVAIRAYETIPAAPQSSPDAGDPSACERKAHDDPRSHAQDPARAPLIDLEGTPLHAAHLSGLDERTSRRLLENGVRTLKALIDQASLPLARRTGIPYTKLLDLSFQARRYLTGRLLPGEASTSRPAFELRPEPLRGGHSRAETEAVRRADPQPLSASPSRADEARGRPWTDVTPASAGTPEDPGPSGPFV